MLHSNTISLPIARPFAQVYGFLSDPRNLPKWANITSSQMLHLGGGSWQITSERGRRTVTFEALNAFGVLDFWTSEGGQPPIATRARALENEDGTELLFTLFKQPGMSDERFASEVEWIRSDLEVLKTYLESA